MTVLHMSNDDRAKIQNVVYEDIRVEYSVHDAKSLYQHSDEEEFVWQRHTAVLFGCDISGPNVWSSDGIIGTTTDVTVRNIQVFTEDDMEFPKMKVEGRDKDHPCKNVTIEDIYFHKILIGDVDGAKRIRSFSVEQRKRYLLIKKGKKDFC